MARKLIFKRVLWLVVMAASSSAEEVHADSAPLVKAAYWVYKPGSNSSQINASDFTHLFLASASLDASTFSVLVPSGGASALQAFPSAVRASNPAVKTLLSISANASTFSTMAASPASRLAFVSSSIALAHTLSFDGLDLDWEFPASDTDMANLASLISEWRVASASSNFSTPLLLTAVVKHTVTVMSASANATLSPSSYINNTRDQNGTVSSSGSNATVSSSGTNTTVSSGRIIHSGVLPSNANTPISSTTSATYPVQAIANSLDWINIKAFDYHGAWEPTKTGEHTGLFDANPNQTATTDYGVRQWLAAGLPQTHAVLGLATYGRTWFLQDPMQNMVGVPAVSEGPGDGIYTYDEIKAFVNSSKAYCQDDVVTKAAFCYGKLTSSSSSNVLWVGFDDPRTIATKVRYLKAKKLRGYFLWSLGFDKNGDLSKQGNIYILHNRGIFNCGKGPLFPYLSFLIVFNIMSFCGGGTTYLARCSWGVDCPLTPLPGTRSPLPPTAPS